MQDFRLLSSSPAINAGTILHADVLPAHSVTRQYVKHQQSEERPVNGQSDIGAYEFAVVAPVQISTASLPNAQRGRFYNQTLQATGGSNSYAWSISAGNLPSGMYLNAATGMIHGKAALRGSWTFTVTAQDSQNPAATAARNLTINVCLFSGF
jgi:hypothetical protein